MKIPATATRRRIAAALIAVGAMAMALPADGPASRPVASRPTTIPVVDEAKLARLVGDLGNESYRTRRLARTELMRIVELPGVAEVLKAHRATARDPSVRTALAAILTDFDQPVVCMWSGPPFQSIAYPPTSLRLFVAADGRFVCDAADTPADVAAIGRAEWRAGKLSPEALLKLKRRIAAGGLADRTRGASAFNNSHPRAWIYLRSGRSKWALDLTWDPKAKGKLPAELALLKTIHDGLKAADGKVYEGPGQVRVAYNTPSLRGKTGRANVQNLPKWSVAGVNLLDGATRTTGVKVSGKQLKAVRAALARTSVYRYHTHAACEVVLSPYVEEAADLYFGK